MTDPPDDAPQQAAPPRIERVERVEIEEPDRPHPFGVFPLVILLVLVAVGLFVAFRLHDVSTLQDCVMSGRKNCAPVDTTDLK